MKKVIKLKESELVNIVKKIVNESLGKNQWCADKTYNLGTTYVDARFNKGGCFGKTTNKVFGIKYDAISNSSPFGSKDPLYFTCDKSKSKAHIFEITFNNIKPYYNNDLENKLKGVFCKTL